MTQPRLSAAEEALYDRQIRLFGLHTQQKLKDATILIAGSNVLAQEIAKNLLLSGVKRLLLYDETPFDAQKDAALLAQSTLLPTREACDESATPVCRSAALLPACSALNPNVKIEAICTRQQLFEAAASDAIDVCIAAPDAAFDAETLWKPFASRTSRAALYVGVAAENGGFFWSVSASMQKHSVSSFGECVTHAIESLNAKEAARPRNACFLQRACDFLKRLASSNEAAENEETQMQAASVAAIVAGFASQEVLQFLTHTDKVPALRNSILYDVNVDGTHTCLVNEL